MNTALYSELLDGRVDAALAARSYPALIDRKDAFLQHDNGPAAHTAAALIKAKILELPSGIKFLPNPAYAGPDLAPPSEDYHLFHGSLLSPRVSPGVFASKPAEWYRRRGVEQLAQRWME